MKLTEIINLRESITFSAAKISDIGGRKVYDSAQFQKEVEAECWACDGTGKDSYHKDHECDMCKGSGKIKEFKTEFGELNVSNANAFEILNMLGVDEEYAGAIEKKDLAGIRRRLIMLKNKGVDAHTSDAEDTQGKARVSKNNDGVSAIKRGPRMIDAGRSSEQVNRYVDKLLTIIDFAQKNDAVVVWN